MDGFAGLRAGFVSGCVSSAGSLACGKHWVRLVKICGGGLGGAWHVAFFPSHSMARDGVCPEETERDWKGWEMGSEKICDWGHASLGQIRTLRANRARKNSESAWAHGLGP